MQLKTQHGKFAAVLSLVFLGQVSGDLFADLPQDYYYQKTQPGEDFPTEAVPSAQLSKLETRIANQNDEILKDEQRMKAEKETRFAQTSELKTQIANRDNELLQDAQQMKADNNMINAAADKISNLQSRNARLDNGLAHGRQHPNAESNRASGQISKLESRIASLNKELLHDQQQSFAVNKTASDQISALKARIAAQDNELLYDTKQLKADLAGNNAVSHKISKLEAQIASQQDELLQDRWQMATENKTASAQILELENRIKKQDNQLKTRISSQDKALLRGTERAKADKNAIHAAEGKINHDKNMLQKADQMAGQISTLKNQIASQNRELLHDTQLMKTENNAVVNAVVRIEDLQNQVADRNRELDIKSAKISELKMQIAGRGDHTMLVLAMIGSVLLILTLVKYKDTLVSKSAKLKEMSVTSSTPAELFHAVRQGMKSKVELISSWMASSRLSEIFETVSQRIRTNQKFISSRMTSSYLAEVLVTVRHWMRSKQEQMTSSNLAEMLGTVYQWLKSKGELISVQGVSFNSAEVYESVRQWIQSKFELISLWLGRSTPTDLKEPLIQEGCSEATNPNSVPWPGTNIAPPAMPPPPPLPEQDEERASAIASGDGEKKQEAFVESDSDESAVFVEVADSIM